MDRMPDIPGATPLADISGLRKKGIRTRDQLHEAEYANIVAPTAKYLAGRPSRRTAPFGRTWMLKLHREMLGSVWAWAGRVRRTGKNIGVEPYRIEVELEKLARDLAFWQDSGMDRWEAAARLHHRAVWIHPFEDGNGRWARLLTNIWLRQQGLPVTRWPERDIAGGASPVRQAYLEALASADDGDYRPLFGLHARHAATDLEPGA